MSDLMKWFWNEEVWLPPGYTWDYLTHSTHFKFPNSMDAWTYPFAIAVTFIALRFFVLKPFVFTPLGLALGISNNRPRPPQSSIVLESVFRRHSTHPPAEVVRTAAAALGWSERQVERWLRLRGAATRATKLDKFCNLAWETSYYVCYCVLGAVVLWDKAWLWDIRHCFINLPEHDIDDWVWWYYMVSLGYYWCMTITHFFQHRRKDSVQLFVHHILTIMLISFSWVVNFVRIGTLVLVVHECGDIPMLIAKMCKLCGRQRLMDAWFLVFLVLWLCTRVGLYPFWIMDTTLFRAHVMLDLFYPVYYIFNGMLISLLLIHIMWTYLILRIVVRMLVFKEVHDVRSSSEASAEDDNGDAMKKEN